MPATNVWWEARCLWGHLVLISRTFARQTLALEGANSADRRRLLTLTIAFAHALVLSLRPGAGATKVTKHFTESDWTFYHASLNPPDAITRLMGLELAQLYAAQKISDIYFQMLDRTVGELAIVQGACERIKNTPVPFSYTLLLQRTTLIFCLLLPFGFVDQLGWGTPVASAFITYTFFGLDALGDEMEQPFGNSANGLPIDALADTIELNLREALGESELPPLPRPVETCADVDPQTGTIFKSNTR